MVGDATTMNIHKYLIKDHSLWRRWQLSRTINSTSVAQRSKPIFWAAVPSSLSLINSFLSRRCLASTSCNRGDGRLGNRPNGEAATPATGNMIFEKAFKVASFGGTLLVKSKINVQIRPTGALEYPNLDQAFVRLFAPSGSSAKVKAQQEGVKLIVDSTLDSCDAGDALLQVEVPIVHNVDVVAEDAASIDVSDFMESDYCNLKSHSGQVAVYRIKTRNLNIETHSGDVVCRGQIQGFVKISSQSGHVVGDKRFLGALLDVDTDSGDIRIASCYAEQSKFSTNSGSMNLRNLHNESSVAVYRQGDVKIHGVDGASNVFVKKGDLDIQVNQIRAESRVHVEEGDIHIRLSDAYPLKISVQANDVIPDTKFQAHGKVERGTKDSVHYFAALKPNEFSPSLVILAENGRAILESQDWAASLGFKILSERQMKDYATTLAYSPPSSWDRKN